ncbi:MAG: hypothetical protein WC996_02830 [Peptostreptococcales bacterium]
MSILGHKVSEVTASKELFKEFYKIYSDEDIEELVGHIVLKNNILYFKMV